jgi:hypothetical protein
MDVLEQTTGYDFYHLPGYHELHEKQGEGAGVMLVYAEDDKIIALPLLVRDVSSIPGLGAFRGYYDATSVYGYAGPIASRPARTDSAFLARFHHQLQAFAIERQWVSIFSRLHPLLNNHLLLTGNGETIGLSDTISIDLTLPPAEQFARYRKSHRYEVRRARREGLTVLHDHARSAYGEFIRLYTDTMRRVHAAEHYFFDQAYFDGLQAALGARLHLFLAVKEGDICAASLFVHTHDIIQYHLSASAEGCMQWAPSKLIIDHVRQWGSEMGARWLHLGGGVGSSEDDLFRFKKGFSPDHHRFYIWKWIVQPEIYDTITEARYRWLIDHTPDLSAHSSSFFPAYRV